MSSKKHAAALAVVIATALVPSFAAQAAEAGVAPIAPLELCHPKWVLPPNTTQIPDQQHSDRDSTGRDQTGGTGPAGWQTVAHDDMTYDGC
jgi:hypothetical protein